MTCFFRFARELEHRNVDRVPHRFIRVADDLRQQVDVLGAALHLGVIAPEELRGERSLVELIVLVTETHRERLDRS